MAKNIIIFGAGGSAQYGAPVMANFLDVARELWAEGSILHQESFERVFRTIGKLQSVHSKAEFDLVNLESVLSAFEMGKIFGSLPGCKSEEVEFLADDFKWVIVETLQRTISQRGAPNESLTASRWEAFLSSINSDSRIIDRDQRTRSGSAIFSFNYDLLLDCALFANNISIDYGISSSEYEPLTLLKLHGSLNWFKHSASGEVFVQSLEKSQLSGHIQTSQDVAKANSAVQRHFSKGRGSDQDKPIPFIVPPTWNKMDSYNTIARVWERAALELSEAQSIFVVGYSLPPTDSFFRLLYALGSVGESPLLRFNVYNLNFEHARAFKDLLGPGARERFSPVEASANEAIEHITSIIQSDV